jgi:anti-sigma-K factor RskA
MSDNPAAKDDSDLRAAELALGLLDPAMADPAHARVEAEPAFAAMHDLWLARALFLSGVQAVKPDPHVWDSILANMLARSPRDGAATRRLRPGWLRAGAVAAAFIAGWTGGHWTARPHVLKGIASFPARSSPTIRPLLAVLTSSNGQAVLVVSFAPGENRLAAIPNAIDPGRKVPELWVIPAGGKPRSLGVLSSGRSSWRPVDPTARPYLQSGATLAVSLEPAGGSPTGLPTGPVILTGALSEPS